MLKIEKDIFQIKHFSYEDEKFKILNAKYNIREAENNMWEFTVFVDCEEGSIQRDTELEASFMDPTPNFEATAILSSSKLQSGQIIYQKKGYDENLDQILSNMYYYEHTSIDELKIKVIEHHEDYLLLNIEGIALVCGTNANEPDAKLMVNGTKFYLDKNLRRGVM